MKFQSGGAIVPQGGLTAGQLHPRGGRHQLLGRRQQPARPLSAGAASEQRDGRLDQRSVDFSGGGFFTGYWLTTGADHARLSERPLLGKIAPSNAIFVGGWYT